MPKVEVNIKEDGDANAVKRTGGGWIGNVFLAAGLLFLAYMAVTGDWFENRRDATSYREDPTSWGRN